ncbi:MAG: biotin--[acetyl-CoA-carboxylase] ligase [Maribacter sp.]
MQLIKLSATPSTNTYLKELMGEMNLVDFTVVSAKNQTHGRGQRDSTWDSEGGKNLTFSILKKNIQLNLSDSFLISIVVPLAIIEVLNELGIPKVKIKWPNDILSCDLKIGGILIENTVIGVKVSRSVIGIGLNVNQKSFNGVAHASSISKIIGKDFDLEPLLTQLLNKLEYRLNSLASIHKDELFKEYHEHLFRKGEKSQFLDTNNNPFYGYITGITPEGLLKVETEKDGQKVFGLKEIKLNY